MIRRNLCLLILLINIAIWPLRSAQLHYGNTKFLKQQKKNFLLPDEVASSSTSHEEEDDRKFLQLFNVYITTYNTVKENRVDPGQRKLIIGFLNKLGARLMDYARNRGMNFQGSKLFLLNSFEGLDQDEEASDAAKLNHLPFKWGRK